MKRLMIVDPGGHGHSVAEAVLAGAIVGTEAQLGAGVVVNCGAVVDHQCRVEDFGHLRNKNASQ